MYEMYPEQWRSEWGPAKHYAPTDTATDAATATLDPRDDAGERPDDN